MLRIFSLTGETLLALTKEEIEGQSVKSLKSLVAKQIGVSRFRQRWLGKDSSELGEDEFITASDVQLLVLDFVQPEDEDVRKLFDACRKNLVNEVDKLLRKPMNPEVWDSRCEAMPLHTAAHFGHVECLALLLEAGAHKDSTNGDGNTPLHCAVRSSSGNLEVLRFLLVAGADKDAAMLGGETALHWAAGSGHLEHLRLLLEAGADKDAVTADGKTALHEAAMSGHLEAIRLLLDKGANKDAVDADGRSALSLAAQRGEYDVVRFLEAPSG